MELDFQLDKKVEFAIPENCDKVTVEKIDNTVVIVFEPKEVKEWYPKDIEVVYVPSFIDECLWSSDYFKDFPLNRELFRAGFIFKTKEEAIAKTNQILGNDEK